MTSSQATRVVLISMGVLAAITLSAHRNDSNPEERVRALWAIGALGVGLAALADVAPQVAGPFALLCAVAMVSRNPGEIGRAIGFQGGGSRLRDVGGGSFSQPAGPAPPGTTAGPRRGGR